jgi:hypothetical protein
MNRASVQRSHVRRDEFVLTYTVNDGLSLERRYTTVDFGWSVDPGSPGEESAVSFILSDGWQLGRPLSVRRFGGPEYVRTLWESSTVADLP